MGIMDEIKKRADDAKRAVSGSESARHRTGKVIDTAAGKARQKAGGKHSKKIEGAASKAKDALGLGKGGGKGGGKGHQH